MALPREEHRKYGPKILRFALITVSSTRYSAKIRGEPYHDESQERAIRIIEGMGHIIKVKDLVDDDVNMVRIKLLELVRDMELDVIIFIGGTGVSKKDVTIEAVKPLLEKELDGFGEIFRWISFQEIGVAAFLSRAMMGTMGDKAVMCLPGSPQAVEVALREFLPELPHLIYILRSQIPS
ncbi:MAG: MogA/MoaB family molybdenum cofactor biosynthesis protein [Nitrososphaeria archaeon]|nr:MogA/MoaB family molybdenum cofactor biosynthesis protein [Aigarchaeota archaeon]MCX8187264.1 MogA/MoaB family molybdenum cofactor biosynthesis protein [Nitrososphaeria archaeon]